MVRSREANEIIDRLYADLDKIVAEHGEGVLFFARMAQGVAELEALPEGCLEPAADLYVETFGKK